MTQLAQAPQTCAPSRCAPTGAPETAGLSAQARWFQMLSDPTRLTILTLLQAGPMHVGEIVAKTGLPQSRISNHLACLRWCNFVNAEKQGRRVVYSIADSRLLQLLALAGDLVCNSADLLSNCDKIGPDWV
jgi:ArsR family transcriptional regulator, cadmium/lead-responsive transcriptional repressor